MRITRPHQNKQQQLGGTYGLMTLKLQQMIQGPRLAKLLNVLMGKNRYNMQITN